MPSPNLAIAHVAASQNQKEVTINDAIDALDRAMTDSLALDLSASPLTVSAAQLRAAMVLHPAAALTGPGSLLVPQIRRVFALLNTDSSFAITVERGASAVAVEPGESALLICDGTADGLFRVGPGAPVYDFGMVAGTAPGAGELLGKVVITGILPQRGGKGARPAVMEEVEPVPFPFRYPLLHLGVKRKEQINMVGKHLRRGFHGSLRRKIGSRLDVAEQALKYRLVDSAHRIFDAIEHRLDRLLVKLNQRFEGVVDLEGEVHQLVKRGAILLEREK